MQRQSSDGNRPSNKGSYQKAKKLLKTIGQHSAKFVSFGSAGTSFIASLAPKFVASRVCENAATISSNPILNRLNAITVVDMGNYLFLSIGTIRAIVLPSLYFAAKKCYSCSTPSDEYPLRKNFISQETQDLIERFERSLMLSANTFSFIQNTPFDNPGLTHAMSAASFVPLLEFGGKLFQKKYPKNKTFNFFLEGVGKLSIVTSTAASAKSLANFICDFFVDSTEEQDWQGQSVFLNIVLVSAAVIALGIVVKGGEKAEFALKQATYCTGMFIITALTIFSFNLCANPSNENPDSFWQNNWLSFIIACTVAIAASALMRYSVKETFNPVTELNNSAEVITAFEEEKSDASQKPDIETGLLSNSQYGTFSKAPSTHPSLPIVNLNSDPSRQSDSDSDSDSKSTYIVNTKKS